MNIAEEVTLFLSYEEATVKFLKDERYRQLMFDSYLDIDSTKAALRYREGIYEFEN